jgi:hypothetical protein
MPDPNNKKRVLQWDTLIFPHSTRVSTNAGRYLT